MTISPLAPTVLPDLPVIKGVRYSSVEAGIRYKNRKDLALMHCAAGSKMAAVFTRSKTRSAPVDWCRANLGYEGEDGIAILVNSGNANAFTGKAGEAAVERSAKAVAEALSLSPKAVHIASTGVIGEVLNIAPIEGAMASLVVGLDETGATGASEAIMTTDTYPKRSFEGIDLDGAKATIAGFAKGSGMIAPDMATMLGFLFTDIKISQELMQQALLSAVGQSFNAITVDSDTSTSDSVYLVATGALDMDEIVDVSDPRFGAFSEALRALCLTLAHHIVKDGEGATKFVEIHVTGAVSEESAKTIALAIANSPLVKTAIAGEDPNWGRIVAAIGKSGAEADRDKLSITIGDVIAAENGQLSALYSEARAAAHMKEENIRVAVDLGLGEAEFTAWTCDLTKRYIEINADYRS